MLERVRTWVVDEASRESLERNPKEKSQIVLEPPSPGSTIRFVDLLARPSPPKYSLYDRVVKYTGAVYHYAGKFCKFLSIALVADPEYQRELDCAFPKSKNPTNSVTRAVLLAIWMWAKAFQRWFLPLFLVRPANPSLCNLTFTEGGLIVPVSSPQERPHDMEEYPRNGSLDNEATGLDSKP